MSEVSGDSGPEAVARMIKLDVKQAQVAPVPVLAAVQLPASSLAKATSFSILIAPPNAAIVLTQDAEWTAALEKENNLAQRLTAGLPFTFAGRQVFVTGATVYPGSRVLYEGVAIAAEKEQTLLPHS